MGKYRGYTQTFTPAQCKIARFMMSYPTLRNNDIASMLKLHHQTVNTQLQRMYIKTGMSRRQELYMHILCNAQLLEHIYA